MIDPRTCAIEVSRTWLDGGSEHRDVRLKRVWIAPPGTRGRWEWADDWVVREGQLLRPGRAPRPFVEGAAVEGETLALDAEGRVAARRRGGRTLEVSRKDGRFTGMHVGRIEVRVEATEEGGRGAGSDGSVVTWREERGELRSVVDAAGARTVYTMSEGRLASVSWADGSTLSVAEEALGVRTGGAGGPWTCRRMGAGGRVTLVGPGGAAWIVESGAEAETVTDPGAGVTRLSRTAGALAGWTDARGGRTSIERDRAGHVSAVADPSGARWQFEWQGPVLAALTEPGGGRWALGHGPRGDLGRLADPAGRTVEFETVAAGWVTLVRRGAASRAIGRDASGRVVSVGDAAGGSVELRRDDAGRVARVVDGGGGAWTIARDSAGGIVTITDPGGARWALGRDAVGRVVSVRDPTGKDVAWSLRADGKIAAVLIGDRDRWQFLRSTAGWLTGLRDPRGHVVGWLRDAVGRARGVQRADGSAVDIHRDAVGDIAAIGGVGVRRDGAGRPLRLSLPAGESLVWDRDGGGRVVGIHGPGVAIALARGPDGALRDVYLAGELDTRLRRDAAGRVIEASGAVGVTLTRDPSGRVVGLARAGAPPIRVDRDARGLEARVSLGAGTWIFGRDAAGRVVSLEAPAGVSLGIDRDPSGRPRLARFSSGAMARYAYVGGAAKVVLESADGHTDGEGGWALDPVGELERLRTSVATTWVYRRDPNGALAAVESANEAWSSSPDGVEGPDGAQLSFDAAGRPRAGTVPRGAAPAWGVASGRIRYSVNASGAMEDIRGDGGGVRPSHDGAGRLVGWEGPLGRQAIVRDALGRVVRIGRIGFEGWNVLLEVDGAPRAAVADVAVARPGGGLVFDPRGTPLLAVHSGAVGLTPGGLPLTASVAESGAAGRVQPFVGGPLVGLSTALDPLSGQSTDGGVRWPWAGRGWEAGPDGSPWSEPDAASAVAWDAQPWAPESPWSDPLALLMAIGELPRPSREFSLRDCDPGADRRSGPTGLPWLPASLAPSLPAPLPDPDAIPLDEEPLVRFVLCHALPPLRPAAPEALAAWLLGGAVRDGMRTGPGLTPALPAELR